jgi:hypothetical protein
MVMTPALASQESTKTNNDPAGGVNAAVVHDVAETTPDTAGDEESCARIPAGMISVAAMPSAVPPDKPAVNGVPADWVAVVRSW